MPVEAASIIPIFIFRETKRLDLRRNQAFHNASGGDKRDRTADLLNAIQALSQLSYTPRCFGAGAPRARSIIAEALWNVKHYFFFFRFFLSPRRGRPSRSSAGVFRPAALSQPFDVRSGRPSDRCCSSARPLRSHSGSGAPSSPAFSAMLPSSVKIYQKATSKVI